MRTLKVVRHTRLRDRLGRWDAVCDKIQIRRKKKHFECHIHFNLIMVKTLEETWCFIDRAFKRGDRPWRAEFSETSLSFFPEKDRDSLFYSFRVRGPVRMKS